MTTTSQSRLSTATPAVATDTFLRRVLLGNVAFSLISATACLLGASALAAFMGIPHPAILMALGAGLLLFALGLYLTASQRPLDRRKVTAIFAADVVWVVASVAILALELFGLTTEGRWLVLIIADVVLVFAVLEFFGLRRLR